ncbi:30S ribosomal protein S17e [Candidatus Aenigmatarchaeota archaeon]
MGRVRTKEIKNLAKELVDKNPDIFTEDYERNKEIITKMNIFDQKKAKYKIAGYIVRIIKKSKNKRRSSVVS